MAIWNKNPTDFTAPRTQNLPRNFAPATIDPESLNETLLDSERSNALAEVLGAQAGFAYIENLKAQWAKTARTRGSEGLAEIEAKLNLATKQTDKVELATAAARMLSLFQAWRVKEGDAIAKTTDEAGAADDHPQAEVKSVPSHSESAASTEDKQPLRHEDNRHIGGKYMVGPRTGSGRWGSAARLALVMLLATIAGCRHQAAYPERPITIVCPWAAGGGTDRVARQLAMLLEQRLGQPVSVTNATGGKGVTGHNRGMKARPDGYTLTMITFELNTMHWAGLTKLTYADCIPLVSVNEDYAAVLVRADAPWKNLADLESAIVASPRTLTASGTAVGGAWHLAFAGWLVAAGRDAGDVVWIPSEGSNPSLQQLISGGVDLVCCSLPEARTLIDSGDVRAIGVMSDKRAVGFEQVPTFKEQGRAWTLGGWRGLAVPLHTPPAIVERLSQEIEAIVSQEAAPGSFAEFMLAQKFDNTWRGADEFAAFLAENDRKLGELLRSDAMRSFSQDRFSPMTYPYALLGLMSTSLLVLLVRRGRSVADQSNTVAVTQPVAASGWMNFALIMLAVVAYVVLAETAGFVLTTTIILLMLLVRLGNRWLPSLAIAAFFAAIVYGVFAYGLRVPLPRGWLG